MMTKFKLMFEQVLLISFGIVIVMSFGGIFAHFTEHDIYFSWYHLLSIPLTGIACSLPSMLLMEMEHMSRKGMILRMVLHCVLVYAITMIMGCLFSWYDSVVGFVAVTVSYFLVYHFVWVGASILGKQEAHEINAALDSIRDEE